MGGDAGNKAPPFPDDALCERNCASLCRPQRTRRLCVLGVAQSVSLVLIWEKPLAMWVKSGLSFEIDDYE